MTKDELRDKLASVWGALIFHPSDDKDQLIGYIKDAQDELSALVGEEPGFFYEKIHRGSVPSPVRPSCPHNIPVLLAHGGNIVCLACEEKCDNFIPF